MTSVFQRAAAVSWEDPFSGFRDEAIPDFDDQVRLDDDGWRVEHPSVNEGSEQAGKVTYSKRDVNGTPHKLIFHPRSEYSPRGSWTHGYGTRLGEYSWRMGNWTDHDALDGVLTKAQLVARPKFSHGEHGFRAGNPDTVYHIPVGRFEPPPIGQQVMSATAIKPKKPRKPEEVWYDVHKHPEGVPGGMGKSPEHHLNNRGWSGHEIHGATTKTIQYHNPKYPDFVISYGGGSSTKPDHNFAITYLGTNTNVPKKHRAYSVAEAMNKVEELHQLQAGHVVLPMTHGAATQAPPKPPSQQKQPGQVKVPKPAKPRDMTKADSYPQFSEHPTKSRKWWNPTGHHYQVHQIPPPPAPTPPTYPPKYSSFEHVGSWETLGGQGLEDAISTLRTAKTSWEDDA